MKASAELDLGERRGNVDNGDEGYRRFLAGDNDGLVCVIDEYRPGLILFVNGITGNINDAEEIAEDTFVRLAVKKPAFRGQSSFKTWLYRIAKNIAADRMRRKKKEIVVFSDDIAEEKSVEDLYFEEEKKRALHRAIRSLNPEYRQVIFLVYFEGFNNEGAAKVMKKNKRQIENLLYRAKQSLKTKLKEEGSIYEDE